jgi:hypothetical protein
MKITQNQESYQLRLIKMTHEVLSDRGMQNILAKKAVIFSPEMQQHEGCLWVSGSGIFSSYRSMFVNLEHLEYGEVKVSVTITDDDFGRTNYLVWGYGDSEDKASIGRMLVFLIDDILDGRGERVTTK